MDVSGHCQTARAGQPPLPPISTVNVRNRIEGRPFMAGDSKERSRVSVAASGSHSGDKQIVRVSYHKFTTVVLCGFSRTRFCRFLFSPAYGNRSPRLLCQVQTDCHITSYRRDGCITKMEQHFTMEPEPDERYETTVILCFSREAVRKKEWRAD